MVEARDARYLPKSAIQRLTELSEIDKNEIINNDNLPQLLSWARKHAEFVAEYGGEREVLRDLSLVLWTRIEELMNEREKEQ